MMRNGIYLTLILFFGVMGYFVVNDLLQENNYMLASLIFLFVSVVMAMLTTHFKKKVELQAAQKWINVVYISLFALYGIVAGVSLVTASSSMYVSDMGIEGVIFILSSLILIYGIYVFMQRKVLRGI